RSRRHGRPTRVVAIALPPIEYLVRVHVILPSNYRDRRARRERRRNDLPLKRLGPRAVTRPTSRGCAHNRFCGHFLPSQHQESHHTSITSSARVSSVGGSSRPSAFAVLR